MADLFLTLLDMSRSAGWVVLAVLLLRLLMKKAPNSLRCTLWALVAIRLLCPVTFESSLSLMPQGQSLPQEQLSQPVASVIPGEFALFFPEDIPQETAEASYTRSPQIPHKQGDPVRTSLVVIDRLDVLSALWLLGLVLMLAYALWSYLRLRKKVQASIFLGNGVFLCDYIDSPFILGLFRPRIYLPSEIDPSLADHVLAHERSHLRRRDHWWKPLGFLLLLVYWFHPLLWVAYILLCRDIELACDEQVIRHMSAPEKKAYSEALLACSISRRSIAACPLAFGESGVRKRVISVLHYKKPTFWVLLVSVLAAVLTALCVLTDPARDPLRELGKLPEQPVIGVGVRSAKAISSQEDPSSIASAMEFLDVMEYDPDPLSQERRESTADEYGWAYPCLEIHYEETTVTFYFTWDYTQVWYNDGVKPTCPFRVADPEAVSAFFDELTDYISNESTAEAPFATIHQPWQWMQNIRPEGIREAMHSSSTITSPETTRTYSGFLPATRLHKLLDILRTIPQDALSLQKEGYTATDSPFRRFHTSQPNVVLQIADLANDLSVFLRYCEDTLELVLCNDMDILTGDASSPQSYTVWQVSSPGLLSFLQEEAEHPSVVQTTLINRYDFQRIPLTVSHGNASITARRFVDWDYEAVEYSEETGSFGIRCRPKSQDSGWLYISFWPDGYTPPEEENRYYWTSTYNRCFTLVSYPAEAQGLNGSTPDRSRYVYSYAMDRFSVGDRVIINEGADPWMLENQDTISDLTMLTTLDYGFPAEESGVYTYGDVTVDFTLSRAWLREIDWDSIAAMLGTKELVLFGDLERNGKYYIGCRSGETYAVAVFQKTEQGWYEFSQLLQDVNLFDIGDDQIPYVTFPCGDELLRIYLLIDETITAYEPWQSFGWKFTIPDQIPTLVIRSYQEEETDLFLLPTHQELVPITFKATLSDIQFKSTTEGLTDAAWTQMYLTFGTAFFYGSGNFPATCTLTQEELVRLRDILTTITPEQVERGPSSGQKLSSLGLEIQDGLMENVQDWYPQLEYFGDSVNLSLTRTPTDLNYGPPSYSYTIRNDALTAFMAAFCDPAYTSGRERYNSVFYTNADPIVSYTHEYASIQLRRQDYWVYETVEYTDDNTPFGIRCRPEIGEGWLFFSFWPQGFQPEEDLIADGTTKVYYSKEPYQWDRESYAFRTGWRYLYFPGLAGDYVVINQGADSWLGMEEAKWSIQFHIRDAAYGEGFLTRDLAVQVVRDLYQNGFDPNRKYVPFNATYSNLDIRFDHHTGIWTIDVPGVKASDPWTRFRIGPDGALLSTAVIQK